MVAKKEKIKVSCACCGKKLYRHPYRIKLNKKQFCSSKCHYIWRQGRPHSKESIKKAAETRKKLYREGKIKVWNKRQIKTKCSYCGKELYRNPFRVKNHKNHFCNRECADKWKIGKSVYWCIGKPAWNRGKKFGKEPKERKEKRIKAILKSLMKRPNKPEEKLIGIIKKHGLPFKYVGNGQFILGGKCPDFLNYNSEKQVIEVFGRVFHDPKVSFIKNIPYHQTYGGTIQHYKKYGFGCLIIWDNELTGRGGNQLSEKEMVNKIKGFMD